MGSIPRNYASVVIPVPPEAEGIQTLFVIPAKAGIQEKKLDSPGSSPGQA
ncbi:MAG: hypothetical protein NT009_01700 [Proteobacteria bacterium]|nr:hypothetical protein [Pseudomonadota bacterium]